MEREKSAAVKYTKPPDIHVIPNNKLINKMTERDFVGQPISLKVSGKRARAPIVTRCILNYDAEHLKIYSSKPFTEFDRCVLNAVASLYRSGGGEVITSATVFRAMTGQDRRTHPSKQQLEAVTSSLDKMRFMRCQIDCSEELRQRKTELDGEQVKHGIYDTYILALSKIRIKTEGGTSAEGYKLLQPPIIYEYARKTGQVLNAPAKLLNIPNTADSVRRIEIKGYLLRRVLAMQKSARTSNRILFSGILTAIKVNNLRKTEIKRIKDYCIKALDYWTESGAMKGYTIIKSASGEWGIDVNF